MEKAEQLQEIIKGKVNECQTETFLVGLVNSLVMTRRFWQHMKLNLTGVGRLPEINAEVH
ncbi:MAG: hypothetical protein ACREQW_09710 [Candidatus Binatia bacterium]